MTKSVKLDRRGIKTIVDGISRPIKKGKPFFDEIGVYLHQQTQITFRVLGARHAHNKWKGFSLRTLHPSHILKNGGISINLQKWNRRRGTDNNKTRRYKPGDKLLQAGGGFRNSFIILKTTDKKVIYGTKMKIAKQIMSDPKREVLFVTSKDKTAIKRKYIRHYNRRQKF